MWPLLAAMAMNTVTVEPATFEGWQNCHRLSNGTIEVVVAPQIGRVVRIGFVGGPNLVWLNPALKGKVLPIGGDWANYGGDKLWNAPQAVWNWPPDATFESAPHDVTTTRTSITLRSPKSQRFWFRFERTITLQGNRVNFENRLINESEKPIEWGIWQVLQINIPDRVTMKADGELDGNGLPWSLWEDRKPDAFVDERDGVLVMKRDPKNAYKVGMPFGDGSIRATFGTTTLTIDSAKDVGGTFPDKNRPRQVYSNPGENEYMELEVNGHVKPVAPGKSSRLRTWIILDRP